MEEVNKLRLQYIKEMEEELKDLNPMSICGPDYRGLQKQLGDLYMGVGQELEAIYHLSESHGATLRLQTVVRYDYKSDLIKHNYDSKKERTMPVAQGIDKKFVEFGNSEFQSSKGFMARLRDMPKEWTVVQLTKQFSDKDYWLIKPQDYKMGRLFISRLPCDTALDEARPVSVVVAPPRTSAGMPSIFDLMEQAVKHQLRTRVGSAALIRRNRKQASENIQTVTEELSASYLRQWRCLLLGRLVSAVHRQAIQDCVDNVLLRHNEYHTDDRSRELLYRVTDGAVYLTTEEIESAVGCVVTSHSVMADLIAAILAFKTENSALVVARRYPVILILDEEFETLPWEMMPILKRHPVSRMPSIHFLHALYHLHKDNIVDGCRLVNKLDLGFYIVNPDQDLKMMEERLMAFLEKRIPQWKGITGCKPTDHQFAKALVDNSVFLYCGHHNGSHFLQPNEVSSLRVVALPLLFGCSSVALQELGGDTRPTGVSDKYLMAGCPCMLGMLWTVTSEDTDCMTVMLLNSWLPNEPIDLKDFRSSGDMLTVPRETELLRLLRHARDTAIVFSNASALVARGIPVRVVTDD